MVRMMKNNRTLTAGIILVAIIVIGALALYWGPAAREARGDDAAKAVMIAFGDTLKNVPLTGDSAAITKAIDDNYAEFVTPELLADWKANHAHAPGRLTSSPWPERLTVSAMIPQGMGRIVNGEVILVTSAQKAGESAETVPYVAQIVQIDGEWKIAAYQEETVQTLKNIPTTDEDIPGTR